MLDNLDGTMIKALCTDIDGTLLDSRRELSETTIEVIRKLSLSIPIVLASSRMPKAMRHLQSELHILQHPLICYNGGYVVQFDAHGDVRVLYSSKIPLEICSAILALGAEKVHIS